MDLELELSNEIRVLVHLGMKLKGAIWSCCCSDTTVPGRGMFVVKGSSFGKQPARPACGALAHAVAAASMTEHNGCRVRVPPAAFATEIQYIVSWREDEMGIRSAMGWIATEVLVASERASNA
jgi:hypothetical protein